MPLYRRMPKRGFSNKAFGTALATVNVEQLGAFEDGATVTPESLVERGILHKLLDGVKVLGDGELKKKLTVKAQRFSGSAREKSTKAGGTCEELPLPGIHHQEKPAKKSGAAKEAKK